MRVLKNLSLLIITFLCTLTVEAQVTASFTADKNTGCPPSLTVNFTNASTPATGVTYQWDFGNGATSTIKNPQAVFVNPGYYTVKLTVSDGTSTDIKTMTIRVYNPPTADFKANPVKGCAPLISQFTDLSVKGDGTINQWSWDYRNGTTSTKAVPDPVTYNTQGKYTVYLKVTDNNGCFGQIEKTNYVDIANKPKVSFNVSPDKSCQIPQTVNFTNTSSGLGNLTYEWTFGNGDQKFTKDASTIYNNYGIYSVKLTVNETDYNCSSTLEYPAVSIQQIDAKGEIKQDTTTIHNNDTICAGVLTFTNQSIGATNIYWNFGDGTGSYLQNATHTYNTQGKFLVKLIASSTGAQCSDTAKWIVNVEKVTSNFTFTPTSGCTSPILVNFTNQSSNAKSYKWTFHDNTVKTQTNTDYTYIIKPDKDAYVIHSEESYPIVLSAYGQHGCENKTTKYFKISLPTALFSVDKTEGCASLVVSFTDKSLPTGNINTRKWIFGDGIEQTTTTSLIQHSYTSPGIYYAKLVVTDASGCTDTSYSITIKVGKKPSPNFQVSSSASFYSDQWINLTDLTPVSDNVNFWSYSVKGYNIPNCPDIKNPVFRYKMDIGQLPIKLIAGSYGCYDSIVLNNIITGLGPLGSFSYDLNCSAPLKYTFNGTVKGATSYEWDFGDGSKNTSSLTPEHTYATAGDYYVKLVSNNNNHYDTVFKLIKVRIPNAVYTSKANSCLNDMITFNGKNSHSIFTSCNDKYQWDFGDGTPVILTDNDSISHAFAKRGTFNVQLTALYENGCNSNYSQSIRIFSPFATVSADTTAGCDNLAVILTDASTADESTLVKWDWDFANGTTASFNSGGNKINKTFTLPQDFTSYIFPVVLTVTDTKGCTGIDTVKIKISKPTADFYTSSLSQLCYPDSAKFIRYFPDADSVIWNFGDGKTSKSLDNPIAHVYEYAGNYGISLKLYKYYCSSYSEKPQGFIQVQKADAKFSLSDTILNCQGQVKFKHIGLMSPVDSGYWHFGDNGNIGSYDTVKYYNYYIPGTYKTKLRVYTSFGCADTSEIDIKLFGPYGDFASNPRTSCKGDTVIFELRDTSNVFKWVWNFGEGIAYTNQDPVKYAFHSVGLRPVALTVYRQDTTCYFTAKKDFPIEEVIAKIGVSDTSVCEGTKVQFSNQSIGQTSFNWDLGDGQPVSQDNPERAYTPGLYNVKLNVSNNNGCKDTDIQLILINPNPIVTLTKDTIICQGSTLNLLATGGNKISWTPDKWLNDASIFNPLSTADSTIRYIAQVSIDSTGCLTKDSVLVTVQHPPVYILSPGRDTSIFVGDEFYMNISANESYLYTWTPQTYILCNTDCSNVTVKPEDTVTYFLTVRDINNCFSDYKKIKVTIKDTCIFGVPNAFTPQGEEKNRILKVEGKGIKELMEFKIYNRWGNLVFQSNDLAKGWDGITNGKMQPIDSYIYTITVKTYKGFLLSKKGTVLLIR